MDGRSKGLGFENKMCRLLSIWLVEGDWTKCSVNKLPFRRRFTTGVPLEGHWDGQGDILHKPGIEFPFCVECKKIEKWELDGIMGSVKWLPWSWWGQCKEQAEKVGLSPLMFFTRNRRATYCLLTREAARCLRLKPRNAPLLEVTRPGGEELLLAVVEDMLEVPARQVRALAKSAAD